MGRWWKRGLAVALALLVLGAAGFFGYFEALKRGWVRYNEYDNRSEGILRVGDPAPDLTLSRVGDGAPVQLSTLYRTRPLALVFGSYT